MQVNGISKSFQFRGLVLKDLSFSVESGDMISIMGPSGSGKTTLLNIIALLDKPDEGRIYFNGKDVSKLNDDEAADYRNKHIGFVFQEHLLLPHLTIYENIYLPLLADKKNKRSGSAEHIMRMMKQTGIEGISMKYPHQVSGGEAQRAALIRALVNKPDILLADEPTGALDSANAGILGDLFRELNSMLGTTVIIATHSEKMASLMKRRFSINSGKLVTE